MEIIFKPTKTQKKYFKAIEWLLSNDLKDRRSGRTTLMAYIFIKMAINNPRTKIYLFDHYGLPISTKISLIPSIKNLLGEEMLNHFKIYHTDFSIMFKG